MFCTSENGVLERVFVSLGKKRVEVINQTNAREAPSPTQPTRTMTRKRAAGLYRLRG